jgi:hypothetical protein
MSSVAYTTFWKDNGANGAPRSFRIRKRSSNEIAQSESEFQHLGVRTQLQASFLFSAV